MDFQELFYNKIQNAMVKENSTDVTTVTMHETFPGPVAHSKWLEQNKFTNLNFTDYSL